MKVLHVIPSIAPLRGGPSQAIIQMVRRLNQLGIAAEIATTNDNGAGLLDLPLRNRFYYQQTPVWMFPRYSPKIGAVREFAFSADFTRWLGRSIGDYDLVHVHAIFSYVSTVTMAIARQQQVPYIVRPLGQLCSWSMAQSRWKKQIYWHLIERANLDQARAIHYTAIAEQQEAELLGLKAPGFVLPHGLDLAEPIPDARAKLRQTLGLPLNQKVILFLSRLHPKKGLDFLIPAIAEYLGQDFSLVIAGSGTPEFTADLTALIAQYHLTPRTHIVGFVGGSQKQIYLQGADLFALTSHSENFGIAVLEALAAGLPALVTPGIALAQVVKDHDLGYVAANLSVSAIALELGKFFAQPDPTMGARAQALVAQEYSWPQITQRLADFYHAV
ncbi:MAG: glycosyltransferase [Pseudanabaenaceae cyanobacterium bins.68]|nr:glycosyltransferase [Pseudanabaenaceae cyanobacterium bins.68]